MIALLFTEFEHEWALGFHEDVEPGFLVQLAFGGVEPRLSKLDPTARDDPPTIVWMFPTPTQKKAALEIRDEYRNANADHGASLSRDISSSRSTYDASIRKAEPISRHVSAEFVSRMTSCAISRSLSAICNLERGRLQRGRVFIVQ